jgi:hypothetical protein
MATNGPALSGLPVRLLLRRALGTGLTDVAAANTSKQGADYSQDEN